MSYFQMSKANRFAFLAAWSLCHYGTHSAFQMVLKMDVDDYSQCVKAGIVFC